MLTWHRGLPLTGTPEAEDFPDELEGSRWSVGWQCWHVHHHTGRVLAAAQAEAQKAAAGALGAAEKCLRVPI